VRCVDRPFDSHPDILYAEMIVSIVVEDIVDLTIQRLRVIGAQTDDLATVGGQSVEIFGSGLGQRGIDALPAGVRAFYGCEPTGPSSTYDAFSGISWSVGIPATVEADPFVSACSYEAQNCEIVEAGSTIRCTTSEGAGANHRWKIQIDASAYGGIVSERHTSPAAGTPERPQATSYAPPKVLAAVSPLLSTEGGNNIRFEGVDFGPSGTEISAMAESAEGWILSFTNCVVVDHSTATCQSDEGVGRGYWPEIRVAG